MLTNVLYFIYYVEKQTREKKDENTGIYNGIERSK